MKLIKLLIKLNIDIVLALSLTSFLIFTKWWYVIVVDGTDEVMHGFPFIYTCRGFHTSLSSQYFIMELTIDIGIYFLCWLFISFLINRFLIQIKTHKILSILLYIYSALLICGYIFIMNLPENVFYSKRPFDVEILDSGYNAIWQKQERPRYEDYRDVEE